MVPLLIDACTPLTSYLTRAGLRQGRAAAVPVPEDLAPSVLRHRRDLLRRLEAAAKPGVALCEPTASSLSGLISIIPPNCAWVTRLLS